MSGTKKISDPDFDMVKFHSKQKHALLEAYLRIWTENVARNFGEKAPQLQLFDLFAGTGMCKEEYTGETWKGSAVLLAEHLSAYPTRMRRLLFINSHNTLGGDTQAHQSKTVTTRVMASNLGGCTVRFDSKPIGDALDAAVRLHDPNWPSVWLLDPWRAHDLPWEIVERVANLQGTTFARRPELFINLMTWQLQQNIDVAPHMMTTALGMPEAEWRPQIDAIVAGGGNITSAIVQIYGERLTKLYGRPPWVIEVRGVEGQLIYHLFFCVERDPAFHSLRTIAIPKYEEWRMEKFKPRADDIKVNRKIDRKAAKSGQEQGRLF